MVAALMLMPSHDGWEARQSITGSCSLPRLPSLQQLMPLRLVCLVCDAVKLHLWWQLEIHWALCPPPTVWPSAPDSDSMAAVRRRQKSWEGGRHSAAGRKERKEKVKTWESLDWAARQNGCQRACSMQNDARLVWLEHAGGAAFHHCTIGQRAKQCHHQQSMRNFLAMLGVIGI